jgi:hypothetical protein
MQGAQRESNLCVHGSLTKGGLRGVVQGMMQKLYKFNFVLLLIMLAHHDVLGLRLL